MTSAEDHQGFITVFPDGSVTGFWLPLPPLAWGVLSVGAVPPTGVVEPVRAAGVLSPAGVVAVCSGAGSVASPHPSAAPQATKASTRPQIRTISTGRPVRPCLTSVAEVVGVCSVFTDLAMRHSEFAVSGPPAEAMSKSKSSHQHPFDV